MKNFRRTLALLLLISITAAGCLATVKDIQTWSASILESQEKQREFAEKNAEELEELRDLVIDAQSDGVVTAEELTSVNSAVADLAASFASTVDLSRATVESMVTSTEELIASMKDRGQQAAVGTSALLGPVVPGAPAWIDPILTLGGAIFAIKKRHRLGLSGNAPRHYTDEQESKARSGPAAT